MTRELESGRQQVQREGLVELGVPRGLADQLAQEDQRIGLRIYFLDNSGSMNAMDGNLLEELPGGRVQLRRCSRWDEICGFAKDHARWNLSTGVPAEFMLLNSCNHSAGILPQEGVDFVRVDHGRPTCVEDLERLLRNNPPRGGTPITQRLQEIGKVIQDEAVQLASKGQIVFLTLATDGLPTTAQGVNDNRQMVEQLKRMANTLPLQMVIRLCTDDANVVSFYNQIDEEYELPLDILDDFESEAKEIAEVGNGFFTYTPVIHRIREAGTLFKLLDSIDEQKFNALEVRKFVELLSPGLSASSDNRAFVAQVRELAGQQKLVFDPVSGQMQPYLNVRQIQRTLKVGLLANLFPCARA